MSEIIKLQIEDAKNQIKAITGETISDDRAFSHVLLRYVFDEEYKDQIDLVTDGSNDGGIDFVSFDDEENKVIVCQSKYTVSLTLTQVVAELSKMFSTVQNFRRGVTGNYNDVLRTRLQNDLDRLDSPDNVEYLIFTTAQIDIDKAKTKISKEHPEIPLDAVTIYSSDLVEQEIQKAQSQALTVKFDKIKIDQAGNLLKYESNDWTGIQCNVLATSLNNLFNKYASKGLFDLNIRKYIRSRLVDSGIKKTLDSERENFWFLNNGIIIACNEFDIDGNTIKLYDFSIVNGGQTTHLIGTYKGSNTKDFCIPCKIVATKKDDDDKSSFFYTKIAEATNSQKPIYPRDLKSNAPEMRELQKCLSSDGIYLEIKRGQKIKEKFKYSIKNDELGQILLSFVHQQPGTSRSGKRKIFDTAATYDKLFKVNYFKTPEKRSFINDIIDLNSRYAEIEEKLKTSGLTLEQTQVLKNGKQTIFALMGICYRLANKDIKKDDILNDSKSVINIPFEYGTILSNYTKDDLEKKLSDLIKIIVRSVTESYTSAFNKQKATSVSDYMKTDLKYYNDIVLNFAQTLDVGIVGENLNGCIDIFKR